MYTLYLTTVIKDNKKPFHYAKHRDGGMSWFGKVAEHQLLGGVGNAEAGGASMHHLLCVICRS